MRKPVHGFLHAVAWIYLWLALALIIASYGAIIYFEGWGRFFEIADPFNIINDMALIATLAPAAALLAYLDKHPPV